MYIERQGTNIKVPLQCFVPENTKNPNNPTFKRVQAVFSWDISKKRDVKTARNLLKNRNALISENHVKFTDCDELTASKTKFWFKRKKNYYEIFISESLDKSNEENLKHLNSILNKEYISKFKNKTERKDVETQTDESSYNNNNNNNNNNNYNENENGNLAENNIAPSVLIGENSGENNSKTNPFELNEEENGENRDNNNNFEPFTLDENENNNSNLEDIDGEDEFSGTEVITKVTTTTKVINNSLLESLSDSSEEIENSDTVERQVNDNIDNSDTDNSKNSNKKLNNRIYLLTESSDELSDDDCIYIGEQK